MNIKSVNNNLSYVNNSYSPKQTKDTSSKPGDKLEISAEAKKMTKSEEGVKNLDSIREKIESKFYESDAVINKVAGKILKEIRQ